jgi:hypothetical protein
MPTEDNDVRDLFAHAHPDSGPQLGITADDIVSRGRRVHRRRRQLAAVGGTVAVIAAAAVLTATLARPPVSPAGPGTSTQVPLTHTGPRPQAPLPTADHTPPGTAPPGTTPPPTTTVTTSNGVPTP